MRSSDSDRALICPASLVRPKTAPRSKNADDAAEWGTLCHYWAETGNANGTTNKHQTLNKKLTTTAIDREKLWPTGDGSYGHETTFSIHLETLQLRIWTPERSKFGRDDWKRRHPRDKYLTGTIDFLSERARGGLQLLPWLDDLKTGSWPIVAKYSLQLRSYAIVPWILGDCNTDVWVSITQWPKYPLGGRPKRNWHLLKSADIARHLQKIRWAVKNTHKAVPNEHACRFCASKPVCNEYQESNIV